MTELDRLRARGILILVFAAWLGAVWLVGMSLYLQTGKTALTLGLVLAANVAPTWMAVRGRYDQTARLTCATLAAVFPAIGVYLLAGHGWQIDGHMYFFVALAALTVLCDWRPIALASALIAVHHLALDFIAPTWVFSGSGTFSRVMVHAVAVGLQFSVLAYITERLRRLTERQEKERRLADALASEAQDDRAKLARALQDLREAQTRENAERDRRLANEAAAEERRRADMNLIADQFEQSVIAIVDLVGRASSDLSETAGELRTTANRTSVITRETALYANSSSDTARNLAEHADELSCSISTIAEAVSQQVLLSENANETAGTAHDSLKEIRDRAAGIVGFSDTIHDLATQINMLALNATIEAALAGDAGRGFAVVASEVKSLARQSETATRSIRDIVEAAGTGVGVADDGFEQILQAVSEVSQAAMAIRAAVDAQQQAGTAIALSARDTASAASHVLTDLSDIRDAAEDTENLSRKVAEASSSLSGISTDLQSATREFVNKLKAA